MANYNFLNLLKPTLKPGKSGFDLSQKHVYSSKAGQLVPGMALETVPGDHHEIKLSSLNRTMSMNTPAFLRGKFKYDFFFVPYSQLWHNFNQFITQRDDRHSSALKGSNHCPVIDLREMLQLIGMVYYFNRTQNASLFADFQAESWENSAVRLLDQLGYGLYYEIFPIIDHDVIDGTHKFDDFTDQYRGKYVNVFRLAAYQHIWYDFYRNKFYDNQMEHFVDGEVREYDYINTFNFDDLYCSNLSGSIIPLQMGRLQDGVIEADFLSDNIYRVIGLLSLHHIQWKKDIFTSALPGTQFGAVSTVDLDIDPLEIDLVAEDDMTRWHKSDGSALPDSYALKTSVDGTLKYDTTNGPVPIKHTHRVIGNTIANSTSFDVLALKRAEALQVWKQNTLRAGNMTDDAFRAHYGVEPYYYEDNNVRYLGSSEAILQINAVEATATTGGVQNGKVADQGATGTAVANGDTIRFDTDDFGVVLCLSSFLPEAEYSANMLDKANTLSGQFDFFTSEFQNIGFEPITWKDYNFNAYIKTPNLVMGYANRYWMYKTAVDKVHGEFAWNNYDDGQIGGQTAVQGSLIAWVTPRRESATLPLSVNDVPTRNKNSWYVDCDILDTVLGIDSDPYIESDSLLHNVYFDIKSIRPMTVLGLPQF